MFKVLEPFLDVNQAYQDDHLGCSSLLHYLINGGQKSSFNDFQEKIQILSKIGFELDKQDYPYLLNSAIGCNNLPATRWILESGKDIEIPSSKWNTPFRQLFEQAHGDDIEWLDVLQNYESGQLQEKLQNTLQKPAFLKTKIKL